MLLELNIKNFIIIDYINVKFDSKLNIITGETGAGKSIIIEAINLALGKKIKNSTNKIKGDKAVIELIFDIDKDKFTYSMIDKEIINDGLFAISREIYSNGKSISRLNGKIISQSALRKITNTLIDVHGQHMHQSLLDEKTHLFTIDSFGRKSLKKYLIAVEEACIIYNSLIAEKKNIEKLNDYNDIDYIEFQLKEIENAEINLESDSLLSEEFNRLNNIEEYINEINNVIDLLDGDKTSINLLTNSKNHLKKISEYNSNIENIIKRIDSVSIELVDISEVLRNSVNNLEFDVNEFFELEKRIDVLNSLMKKYGPTLIEVIDYGLQLKNDLQNILKREQLVNEIDEKIEIAYKDYIFKSNELSKIRKSVSKDFNEKIIDEIKELNLKNIIFETAFSKNIEKIGNKISSKGFDSVKFLISTNIGIPPMPLKEVASGGEISRVMLGIKAVLSNSDLIETLIFDEIDTGISGETAFMVGKKMAKLSNNKQIIAITHLSQIAAAANRHFKIEKLEGLSNLTPLTDQQHIEEVARIVSGKTIFNHAIENSKVLIKQMNEFHRRK